MSLLSLCECGDDEESIYARVELKRSRKHRSRAVDSAVRVGICRPAAMLHRLIPGNHEIIWVGRQYKVTLVCVRVWLVKAWPLGIWTTLAVPASVGPVKTNTGINGLRKWLLQHRRLVA